MPDRQPTDAYVRAVELLADKVRRLREDRGLTQEKLRDRSGVSRNQIQNIEHNRNNTKDTATGRPGRANTTLDVIFALAQGLEVEITYLVDPTIPVDPLPAPAGRD